MIYRDREAAYYYNFGSWKYGGTTNKACTRGTSSFCGSIHLVGPSHSICIHKIIGFLRKKIKAINSKIVIVITEHLMLVLP